MSNHSNKKIADRFHVEAFLCLNDLHLSIDFLVLFDLTLCYSMDGWIRHVAVFIHTILKDAKRKDSWKALLLDADRTKQNFARFGS